MTFHITKTDDHSSTIKYRLTLVCVSRRKLLIVFSSLQYVYIIPFFLYLAHFFNLGVFVELAVIGDALLSPVFRSTSTKDNKLNILTYFKHGFIL